MPIGAGAEVYEGETTPSWNFAGTLRFGKLAYFAGIPLALSSLIIVLFSGIEEISGVDVAVFAPCEWDTGVKTAKAIATNTKLSKITIIFFIK
jgi:hypothetical protein